MSGRHRGVQASPWPTARATLGASQLSSSAASGPKDSGGSSAVRSHGRFSDFSAAAPHARRPARPRAGTARGIWPFQFAARPPPRVVADQGPVIASVADDDLLRPVRGVGPPSSWRRIRIAPRESRAFSFLGVAEQASITFQAVAAQRPRDVCRVRLGRCRERTANRSKMANRQGSLYAEGVGFLPPGRATCEACRRGIPPWKEVEELVHLVQQNAHPGGGVCPCDQPVCTILPGTAHRADVGWRSVAAGISRPPSCTGPPPADANAHDLVWLMGARDRLAQRGSCATTPRRADQAHDRGSLPRGP